jgi:hypothetical protein
MRLFAWEGSQCACWPVSWSRSSQKADSSALEGLGAMDRSLGMLLICLSGVALDSAGCSEATDSSRGGLVDV